MPKVSIIVPIYNTEATLCRCIDSIIGQSYKDIEIIIVNDGTPDAAGDIADRYASQHSFIHVIHQPNAGLAEARHAGVGAASSPYLIHVDSDDTIPPNAVHDLYRRIKDNDLDIAYGAYNRVSGSDNRVVHHAFSGLLTSQEFFSHLFAPHSICSSWGCISKRSIWHDDVFPDSSKKYPSEDVLINAMLSKYVERVGFFNDIVVYNYHYNPASLSSTGALYSQPIWKEYLEIVKGEICVRDLWDKMKPRFQIFEIDRIAFYIPNLDLTDEWIQLVLNYDNALFPLKTKILQFLLRYPTMLHRCIKLNRQRKRLFSPYL